MNKSNKQKENMNKLQTKAKQQHALRQEGAATQSSAV
jgi:hypothetical protein